MMQQRDPAIELGLRRRGARDPKVHRSPIGLVVLRDLRTQRTRQAEKHDRWRGRGAPAMAVEKDFRLVFHVLGR